ncbi:putative F-box protein-like [Capsicum annuum]|nr:putative F-box protein-like [Capsicum annuum]
MFHYLGGVPNCHSLRKLSLRCVSLDENVLQTLFNSCSLIVSFILKLCKGLEKIEVLNLQKIKSISIKAFGNQRVKIKAPTLEHLSYSYEYSYRYERKTLDDVECQSLKSLKLKNVSLSDGCLNNLISRSEFLKVLKICYCEGIRDIDSSNLVSLKYTGFQIPELKMASESSKLKHSKFILNIPSDLNATWFCKLRKFLSNLTSSSQVFIDFFLDAMRSTSKV